MLHKQGGSFRQNQSLRAFTVQKFGFNRDKKLEFLRGAQRDNLSKVLEISFSAFTGPVYTEKSSVPGTRDKFTERLYEKQLALLTES